MKFQFGDHVKDKFTGLTGHVVAYTVYYTGCIHVAIIRSGERKVKDVDHYISNALKDDGAYRDWEWLDQLRLELLEDGHICVDKTNEDTIEIPNGGPEDNPNTSNELQHP